jgi:murein DD-endopeptidase MepM/ murein hydrolase activator NlpD
MTGRMLAIITATVLGVGFLCVGGLAAVSGSASACAIYPAPSGATHRYDADQLHNAAVIVIVGARRNIPIRGQIIAVATALQESNLRNLGFLGDRNDHDSLGLFQQRPSQGWGTPEQIMNPEHASGKFYDKLLTVPGWEDMTLTQAAQAVQRSAYPDAYAKHEPDANAIITLLASSAGTMPSGPAEDCASVAGWIKPVQGPIVSPFGQRDDALHAGVDISAPKGAPIHAAASGIVIKVRCNAHLVDGGDYSCDIDGDPVKVRGCGWYAEIEHADHTITRYCHMVSRPMVNVGQTVAVGQIIGLVGSSGHSSGPHLHLEAHLGAPATNDNAVDPIGFFRDRLVDLTQP